jgi:hypothetical protein
MSVGVTVVSYKNTRGKRDTSELLADPVSCPCGRPVETGSSSFALNYSIKKELGAHKATQSFLVKQIYPLYLHEFFVPTKAAFYIPKVSQLSDICCLFCCLFP